MYNYKNEGLYIAGPECFYPNGYELWWAQRKLAEYYGIPVVLPTSTELKLDNEDLTLNAKEIFDDLIVQVGRTTAIIADLELFRGSEPDGGTIFEMGWIWQKGGRLYGYTRDKRTMAEKNQAAYLISGVVIDQDDRALAYSDLTFSPDIMGSTKIIEGDFKDALKSYLVDLEEERKSGVVRKMVERTSEKNSNRVFISSAKRYQEDYAEYVESTKAYFLSKGYEAVFPQCEEVSEEDPLRRARLTFDSNMNLLSTCDAIIADLNNFHGFEPSSDVSFECGAAYGMGLKCLAFTSDDRIMRERIPRYDDSLGGLDWCGNIVENFNLPINLMFGSSFKIVKGTAVDAIKNL